jgi:hypothetical protein
MRPGLALPRKPEGSSFEVPLVRGGGRFPMHEAEYPTRGAPTLPISPTASGRTGRVRYGGLGGRLEPRSCRAARSPSHAAARRVRSASAPPARRSREAPSQQRSHELLGRAAQEARQLQLLPRASYVRVTPNPLWENDSLALVAPLWWSPTSHTSTCTQLASAETLSPALSAADWQREMSGDPGGDRCVARRGERRLFGTRLSSTCHGSLIRLAPQGQDERDSRGRLRT